MGNKKKVLVIATGGTIASEISDKGGLSPQLSGKMLTEMLASEANKEAFEIEALQLMKKDSTNLDPNDWDTIIHVISDNIDDYDGIVVLSGTDTMAYAASALSYVLPETKPIVFTGSMLTVNAKGSDAAGNFNHALSVAGDSAYAGVFVAFGGKVIPGVNATKITTENSVAFGSKNNMADKMHARPKRNNMFCGVSDKNVPMSATLLRDKNGIPKENFDANVFVLHLTPGFSPGLLEKIAAESDGIVIEVFGTGGLPDSLLNVVSNISKEKPVVLVTQVPNGIIDLDKYDVGKNAKDAGVIDGKGMTVEAAVTKLMYVLKKTKDINEIRSLMSKDMRGEFGTAKNEATVATIGAAANSAAALSDALYAGQIKQKNPA
ncbi:MAG: asparaginase [Candidatus Micrarchaeaceae archaeon]